MEFCTTESKQQSLFIYIENEMKDLHNSNASHENSYASSYYWFIVTAIHDYTPMPEISNCLTV